MKTFSELAMFSPAMVLAASAALAAPPAPQFAVIQTDSATYTVGQQASVTVSVLIQPANPNDEIALVAKLGGSQIDLTQLSSSEWATVTPALESAGNVNLEVDVYLEDKVQADSLDGAIAFYQQEICSLEQKLSNEHDPAQQAALKDQIARDQGLIEVAKQNLDNIRREVEVDTDTLTVNPPKSTARITADSSPAFVLDADHSNRIYHEGDIATFSLTLTTSFTGPDGPQEVVARGLVDGSSVGAIEGSPTQFSFASSPFTDYQIGADTFTGKVLIRSQARSDSIRGAIAQAEAIKAQDIAAESSTSDPDQQAYYKQEIAQLTTLIGQYNSELESMLTLVGTGTLDFTVRPANRDITLVRTGQTQTIDIASQIESPSGAPLKLISVTDGSRGTAVVNNDGKAIYTPDSSKKFRVFMGDTDPEGNPGNSNVDYGKQIVGRRFGGPGNRYLMFNSKATNLDPRVTAAPSRSEGYIRDLVTGKVTWATPNYDGSESALDDFLIFLSGTGQRLTFETNSAGVVPEVRNATYSNVYVRDRRTGTIGLVSVAPDGLTPGNGDSTFDFLSFDGSTDAFLSKATNLVTGQNSFPANSTQAYVRDLRVGKTILIGRNDNGTPGNGSTIDLNISENGRFVPFTSTSTGNNDPFVPAPPNNSNDASNYCGPMEVYLFDRGDASTSPSTKLVSVEGNGNLGNAGSCGTILATNDGENVMFESISQFLPDSKGHLMIYNKDLRTGDLTRVVNAYDGSEPNADLELEVHGITSDGRFVTFFTTADNLLSQPLPQNLEGQQQCYLVDTQSPKGADNPLIVNVDTFGNVQNGCRKVNPSPDGQAVAVFMSPGSTLTGTGSDHSHIYVVTKTDQFSYTAMDPQGNTVTGTVTLTEPLIPSQGN